MNLMKMNIMTDDKKVSYEDKVIQAAREGFGEALWAMDDKMEDLLRLVYRAGYKMAQFDASKQKQNEL